MVAEQTPLSPPTSPGCSPTNGSLPKDASHCSIISGKSGRPSRVDIYGNAIEKGKKQHRCSFPDERDPSRSVEEKIEVKAHKGPIQSYDSQPGCGCALM
mmetsp:Transcript_85637/g.227503  ORF Transcript_85637/g.227503 Transcript_85637/m.227503 type:complete len:99 (-) Transcript_85637:176-472(-)